MDVKLYEVAITKIETSLAWGERHVMRRGWYRLISSWTSEESPAWRRRWRKRVAERIWHRKKSFPTGRTLKEGNVRVSTEWWNKTNAAQWYKITGIGIGTCGKRKWLNIHKCVTPYGLIQIQIQIQIQPRKRNVVRLIARSGWIVIGRKGEQQRGRKGIGWISRSRDGEVRAAPTYLKAKVDMTWRWCFCCISAHVRRVLVLLALNRCIIIEWCWRLLLLLTWTIFIMMLWWWYLKPWRGKQVVEHALCTPSAPPWISTVVQFPHKRGF